VYQHILAATDGSPLAEAGVTSAARLAAALKARLTVFYAAPAYHMPYYPDGVIVDWPDKESYEARVGVAAQKILARAKDLAAAAGVDAATLSAFEDAADVAIVAAAREAGCDLIVMASHGRSAITSLVLGSMTRKVLTHSKIPVLVLR
jgi:nucleotide-binding universal stress UspA family protein